MRVKSVAYKKFRSPLVSEKTAYKLKAKNTVTLAYAAQIVRVSFVYRAILWETATTGRNNAAHTNCTVQILLQRKNIGAWSALS